VVDLHRKERKMESGKSHLRGLGNQIEEEAGRTLNIDTAYIILLSFNKIFNIYKKLSKSSPQHNINILFMLC